MIETHHSMAICPRSVLQTKSVRRYEISKMTSRTSTTSIRFPTISKIRKISKCYRMIGTSVTKISTLHLKTWMIWKV